jgi:hypothetical protein
MHRLFVLGVLFLAGCHNVIGPFEPRKPERVDDPLLSINEQQRRGRDRLALPEESARVAPGTDTLPPTAGSYRPPR